MRIHLFVAAAVIALLGSCASADAANVIVGNPLLNTSKYAVGCGSLSPEGCTFVSLELPKSAGIVRSPVDGAIVSWSIKGAWPEAGYAIRVLKLGGSLEATRGAGNLGIGNPAQPRQGNLRSRSAHPCRRLRWPQRPRRRHG